MATNIHQMRFRAPHGRTEVLWVEEQGSQEYRVMNVPVWLYGISVGTLVSGRTGTDGMLEYRDLIEPSPGATLRYLGAEEGTEASKLYLSIIGPRASTRGIALGPATFFDPLIVAVHLHDRSVWNTMAADFFNELVDEGVIEQWEIGDPDEYGDEHEHEEAATEEGGELIHPKATTDRDQFYSIQSNH